MREEDGSGILKFWKKLEEESAYSKHDLKCKVGVEMRLLYDSDQCRHAENIDSTGKVIFLQTDHVQTQIALHVGGQTWIIDTDC